MKSLNLLVPFLAVLLAGCASLQNLDVNSLTRGGGSGTGGWDIMKLSNATKALRSGFADISESEEYYIGRAVSAQILARYKPLTDPGLNLYAQKIAQAVALASDRPSIYKGYHVQVLDTDEINAFAAPGGFIFVTKGMLALAKNEDELACVLAHEVAHISKKHGLKTIQTSRLTSAFTMLGAEAAKHYTPEQVSKLTAAFEGAVDDVVNKLVVNGYSRDKEYEADRFAAEYAKNANYDPRALTAFLTRMEHASASGGGMFKTHPDAAKRVSELGTLTPSAGYRASSARETRFANAVSL